MPSLFLSYAHEDIGMAKRVFRDLKRFGLEIWFDNESLLPGQRWEIEIEKAIKSSTHFLILLSSHSTGKRGFVQKELRLALDVLDQCPEEDIYILPVRLDECNPSLKIKALHWVDLYPEGQYVNGLRKILQVVRPEAFMLRNKPKELSQADVVDMIRKHGFYEYSRNPDGVGFSHKYLKKEIRSKTVICDEATNLIWQ